jgi:hypothetical protein
VISVVVEFLFDKVVPLIFLYFDKATMKIYLQNLTLPKNLP